MAKVLKTSAEGRKCTFPNCNRLLSIYNHEPFCHVHRDKKNQATQLQKIPYHHPTS